MADGWPYMSLRVLIQLAEDVLFCAGESASHMTFVLSGQYLYEPGTQISKIRADCANLALSPTVIRLLDLKKGTTTAALHFLAGAGCRRILGEPCCLMQAAPVAAIVQVAHLGFPCRDSTLLTTPEPYMLRIKKSGMS